MIRSRRDELASPPDPQAVATIVGRGTELKGDLKSSGSVRIDGKLEGTLHTTGDLIVGEDGLAVATVHAASILVAGEIQGQVKATSRLEVTPTGRIRGDVETPVLIVNEGGKLDGKCIMAAGEKPGVAQRPSAAAQAAAAKESTSSPNA